MATDLAPPLEQLRGVVEGLRARVEQLIPDGDVDANQSAANQLAWAVARSEAAIATAEWAEATGSPLASAIAEAVIADAHSWIAGRSALDVIEQAPLFQRISRSHQPLEDLGASSDERLLRETFRDFARREIRPRADEIHRENLDVPEEILRGLGGLGALGLSIPEDYGGSQGDDQNFEAMLIVTEGSRARLWQPVAA